MDDWGGARADGRGCLGFEVWGGGGGAGELGAVVYVAADKAGLFGEVGVEGCVTHPGGGWGVVVVTPFGLLVVRTFVELMETIWVEAGGGGEKKR